MAKKKTAKKVAKKASKKVSKKPAAQQRSGTSRETSMAKQSVWEKDRARLQDKLAKDPLTTPPAPETVAKAKAEELRQLLRGMTAAQIELFADVVLYTPTPDQIIEYLLSRKFSTQVWDNYLAEVPRVIENA